MNYQKWSILQCLCLSYCLWIKSLCKYPTYKPLNPIVYLFCCSTGLVGFTVWKFYIKRDVKNNIAVTKIPILEEEEEEENGKRAGKVNTRSTNNNMRQRPNLKNGSAWLYYPYYTHASFYLLYVPRIVFICNLIIIVYTAKYCYIPLFSRTERIILRVVQWLWPKV